MSMLTTASLSLEAGAAHLERLLQQNLSPLQASISQKLAEAQTSDSLQALFPGGSLYEDWKYTPLSILRTPWSLTQSSSSERLQGLLTSLPSLKTPTVQAIDTSPALESLPAPATPWEKLILAGATSYKAAILPHAGLYGLSISQPTPFGVAPTFYTLHIPAGVQAEMLLSTDIHPEGLLLLQIHVALEAGARLTLYHSAPEGSQGNLLFIFSAAVQKDARLSVFSLPARYRWVRTESRILLIGPGAEGLLYGAHTVHESEVCDTAVRVSHLAPHTHSNQLFRSLAFRGGRRVFLGRIHVAREGQKTNAYQSHKALLWDRGAEVYSRPQLEIFADDVRCTHGVTTGFLQGEMLFYLRARGLPEATARTLIAEGFLMEAFQDLPVESLSHYARSQFGFTL